MAEGDRVAEPEVQGITVVVVGRFNPAIFSPAWLRMNNLIGASEAERAQIQVIIPPAAVFAVDWLQVDVTEDRLVLATVTPQEQERLREIATGVLSLLTHTPVGAVGLNVEWHWKPPTLEAYHALGDALAPKEFWSELVSLPGTRDLTVEGVRTDEWAGAVRVTMQPSTRIPHGVYARVNDHMVLSRVPRQPTSRQEMLDEELVAAQAMNLSAENMSLALEILKPESWATRLESSRRILQSLVQLAERPN